MKAVLNVKVDVEVKKRAQKFAAGLGLPLSALVNAHLRQVVYEQEVRFVAPEKMSKKLERQLARVDVDIKAGRNLSPVFHSGKEMDEYLDSL